MCISYLNQIIKVVQVWQHLDKKTPGNGIILLARPNQLTTESKLVHDYEYSDDSKFVCIHFS